MKNIYIASDHAGYETKQLIKIYLTEKGYRVFDFGNDGKESCDYPSYAHALASHIRINERHIGIAICGTGNGMAMVCNRYSGVRCALVHDVFTARMAREHNDANIIAIGARVVKQDEIVGIVDVFLESKFSNEDKHIRRITMF